MPRLKTTVLALAGLLLAPAVSHAHTPNAVGQALMNLNAAQLKDNKKPVGDIWSRLRQDFRLSEVNPELVRRHEQYYASRSPYFNRTIDRSRPYLYHIANEVEKRKMPAEIALLPFIESAFVTKARSHVGASGLWQFMPATGRQYGLAQTHLYDDRHDVYAATDAALNYLQYLYGLFGDWSLALAAYNWGEGSVGRAVARAQAQGLAPVYENLKMPNETRNYVPKLLAVRNLINNPQAFGLNLSPIDNKPYFKAVTVDTPLDIQAAARLAGVTEEEFNRLNPSPRVPVFLPKTNRKMLLPVAAASVFERNYRAANKADLLSWDIHTVHSGTTLTDLAARSGMSVADIKRINNISSNSIASGRSILLAKNSSTGMAAFSRPDQGMDPLLAQAIAHDKPTVAPDPVPVMNLARNAAAVPVADIVVQSQPAAAQAAPVNTAAASVPRPNTIRTEVVQAPAAATPPPLAQAADPIAAFAQSAGLVEHTAPTATAAEPVQAAAPSDSTYEELMSLTLATQVERDPRQAVQNALAQAEAEEARRNAAAEQRRAAAPKTAPAPTTYTVQSGDTLFSVAKRHNISMADLSALNKLKSQNIRQGQVLKVAGKVPASAKKDNQKAGATPASYTVKKGDTLQAIAQRFNVPVSQLRKLNKSDNIRPGQKIKLSGA
ncbi:membrane-bound lytic murein transglycosylase D [Neisseria sp. HSC-16F19]|nr:LysM peptidoglycan-binding domain-containing protein [Neisseria sp. HSC-16F19]MCP2041344.1 membrane-bound lytic murein transglycosylase D [Neisseria sp. HSC-16F19]